jgi:hypothetical protein
MDGNSARMAEGAYCKPEVFTLGSVSELTRFQKDGGSADVWGQQSPDEGQSGGSTGGMTGH